jgi:F-type H+-transporting ATPase subunit delta
MAKVDRPRPEIVRGYAQAMLMVAAGEEMLDQVEQELTQFKKVLEKNSSILEFLKDPKVAPEGKEKAVGEILGGDVSQITLHQVMLAIGQGRGELLPDIIDEFFRFAAESRKRTTAEVVTAVPLSEETGQKLEQVLSELIGEAVFLKKAVDPSLLGGLVVRVGERIIDGSIRGQLLRLKEGLSREILTEKGRSIEDKSR